MVICDRYYDATEAYQCYGKGLSHDFFKSLNKVCNLSIPEITFYIDITSEISKERISNRERDRMEAEEIDFFNKKVKEYYGWNDEYYDWKQSEADKMLKRLTK